MPQLRTLLCLSAPVRAATTGGRLLFDYFLVLPPGCELWKLCRDHLKKAAPAHWLVINEINHLLRKRNIDALSPCNFAGGSWLPLRLLMHVHLPASQETYSSDTDQSHCCRPDRRAE